MGSRVAQGVYGSATVASPVTFCGREEPECTRALAGARIVISRDGDVVASTRTGSEGGYRVALAPGRYSVSLRRQRADVRKRPEARPRVPRRPDAALPARARFTVLARRTVTVSEGEFRRVDFTLEIRGR